ncbi:MAG TPA: hypothetical protein VK892_11470 [Pyrinomonadaceae bacterium]|nr:hypothetical protein [Pyrinomonadaceae bacterium]
MKNSTIRVKNELPELLEAVCAHPDCPDWLKEGIWDVVSGQNQSVLFTATYWRSAFEAIEDSQSDAEFEEIGDLPPNVIKMEVAQ